MKINTYLCYFNDSQQKIEQTFNLSTVSGKIFVPSAMRGQCQQKQVYVLGCQSVTNIWSSFVQRVFSGYLASKNFEQNAAGKLKDQLTKPRALGLLPITPPWFWLICVADLFWCLYDASTTVLNFQKCFTKNIPL